MKNPHPTKRGPGRRHASGMPHGRAPTQAERAVAAELHKAQFWQTLWTTLGLARRKA